MADLADQMGILPVAEARAELKRLTGFDYMASQTFPWLRDWVSQGQLVEMPVDDSQESRLRWHFILVAARAAYEKGRADERAAAG